MPLKAATEESVVIFGLKKFKYHILILNKSSVILTNCNVTFDVRWRQILFSDKIHLLIKVYIIKNLRMECSDLPEQTIYFHFQYKIWRHTALH